MLMRPFAERRFTTLPPESISQNPSESLVRALGGVPSTSGATVTEISAQNIPVVFACDKTIAEDVARAPIKLMRRLPDGTREPDVNHPVYTLLHDYANPAMTAPEFKETAQRHVNLWGNHYSEIERDRHDQAKALWPLDPARMVVDLDGLNRLRYTYTLASGRPKTWIFDPAKPPILHIRQNSLDGIHGRSPVRVLRDTMGLAVAAQESASQFFGQGMLPAGAVTTDAKLTKPAADRVRADLERILAGHKNFHRFAVLDRGLKWQPLTMPGKDVEFLGQRKFGRSELAGCFRVPAHKVNDLEKATFSNIEHQAIQYIQDALMPQFVRWQAAIARDLLHPSLYTTHFAVFVVDSLVQGDIKTRNVALQLQRQNGIIHANEWRRLVDMDDRISDEDGGNLYLVNGNMKTLGQNPAAMIDGLDPPSGQVN